MTQYALYNPTALFAGEDQPVHDYVIVDAPAQALPGLPAGTPATFLPRGTVLGSVTGGANVQEPHHAIVSVATASDGSNVPRYVLAEDVDLSGGSLQVPVYQKGEYAFERLVLDPSWSFNLLQQACQESPLVEWRPRQLGILG